MLKRKGYLCGPTLYDLPHIGNIKTFYTSIKHFHSVKKRKHILLLNYTDIGDKIYERSGIGEALIPYINYYAQRTTDLLKNLGLKPWVLDIHRASLNIKKIKKDILRIIRSPLWDTNINQLGIRGVLHKEKTENFTWHDCETDFPETANGADFSLWRSGKYPVFKFNSLGLTGIPGWHNECASLVNHYCDQEFIHYGGIDLKQLHHKNECALFSTLGTFKTNWIYVQPICVSLKSKQKISKSKNTGSLITPEDCSKWIPFLESLSIKKMNVVNPNFSKEDKTLNLKSYMRSKKKIMKYYYSRLNAKKNKNFAAADRLRIKLLEIGVKCKDIKEKTILYR